MTEGFSCPKASWDTGIRRAHFNQTTGKNPDSWQDSMAQVWHQEPEESKRSATSGRQRINGEKFRTRILIALSECLQR